MTLTDFFRLGKRRAATRWLNIELSSQCNLRCKWCTLDHRKPAAFLDEKLLEKVVDEVAYSGHFLLDQIDLHNGGETLLHPELGRLLQIIALRKASAAAFPQVNLLTNGVLLTGEMSETILSSGAVDLLRFSIDGGSAKAFEEIRRGARWVTVRDNIARLLRLKQKSGSSMKTGVICIVPPERELDTGWMEREFRELLCSVDGYELRYPHNWDGSKGLGIAPGAESGNRKGKICKFLMKNLVMLPNGDVTVCCADLNGRGIVGNVGAQSLYGIYRGSNRAAMVERYASGKKADIALCANCEGYYEF